MEATATDVADPAHTALTLSRKATEKGPANWSVKRDGHKKLFRRRVPWISDDVHRTQSDRRTKQ